MSDSVRNLGRRSLTSHTPALHSWHGLISKEPVDDFMELTQTLSNIGNSSEMPLLVSQKSEPSVYHRHSRHSSRQRHSSVKHSVHMSALDLWSPRCKISSSPRGLQLKNYRYQNIYAQDPCVPEGHNVNLYKKSTGIKNTDEIRRFAVPAVVRVSSSGSELSLRSEMSSVSNRLCQEIQSHSNHIMNRTTLDGPALSNRSSMDMSMVLNSKSQESSRFVPNFPGSKELMEEASVLDAVNDMCSDELSEPFGFSSVDLDSIGIQQNEDLANTPLSKADFSFPVRQCFVSEQSPKFQRGDSNYHSETVPIVRKSYERTEMFKARAFHRRRQELNKLIKENITLNKEINMMRQRHMVTKKNLRRKQLCLLNKLAQLQSCRGSSRRVGESSRPVEELPQKVHSAEVRVKGRQREPLSSAPNKESILIPNSTEVSALETSKFRATKMDLSGPSRTSGYQVQTSPMESITATVNHSNEADIEDEDLNRSKVDKKTPQSLTCNKEKSSSSCKGEFSHKKTNCAAGSKSIETKVAGKTGEQKGCKTDKDEKVIKSPVFDLTNLIINYLPPEMNSSFLQKIFAPYGEIVSCKVVMDHKTGTSKGYGFVKFKREEQAKLAVEKLDQFHIGGKVLKVAYARRSEGGKQEHKQTNLYVANLDKSVDTSDIKREFSKCGYVVQCKVLKDVRGVTRRIGFVRFDSHEGALRAIKRYDGKKMEGTKSVIQVRFANVPKPPRLFADVTPMQLNSPVQHAPQFFSQSILQDDFLGVRTQFCFDTQSSFVQSHSRNIVNPSSARKHFSIPPCRNGFHNPQRINGLTFNDPIAGAKSRNLGAACFVTGTKRTAREGELERMFDPEGLNQVKRVNIVRRPLRPYAHVNCYNAEEARNCKNLNRIRWDLIR